MWKVCRKNAAVGGFRHLVLDANLDVQQHRGVYTIFYKGGNVFTKISAGNLAVLDPHTYCLSLYFWTDKAFYNFFRRTVKNNAGHQSGEMNCSHWIQFFLFRFSKLFSFEFWILVET